MKKALVCGAGGFIGSHLVKKLKRDGYWVRGVDLKYPEYDETAADEFEILDLRRWDSCLQATRGIDEVYALAADMGGMGFITTHHSQILYNNSLINLHTMEAARLNSVNRYLYTSSACVYPEYLQTNADVTPLKEEDAYPAQPQDAYGWEKLMTEILAKYYHQDPSKVEPLYALVSRDANGDGQFDDQTPGEEAPALYQIVINGEKVSLGRLTNPSEYIPKRFTLSPDRTKLAFSTEAIPDIGELLYIKDLTSSKPPEQVLADTFQVHGIYWSRDGERLAAVVTDSTDADQVLYVTPDGLVKRTGDVQLLGENEIQDYDQLVAPNYSKRLWPNGVEGGFMYTMTGPVDEPGERRRCGDHQLYPLCRGAEV